VAGHPEDQDTSSAETGGSAGAVAEGAWRTPGVAGIGVASFLADVGHEVPTALLPSFVGPTHRRT